MEKFLQIRGGKTFSDPCLDKNNEDRHQWHKSVVQNTDGKEVVLWTERKLFQPTTFPHAFQEWLEIKKDMGDSRYCPFREDVKVLNFKERWNAKQMCLLVAHVVVCESCIGLRSITWKDAEDNVMEGRPDDSEVVMVIFNPSEKCEYTHCASKNTVNPFNLNVLMTGNCYVPSSSRLFMKCKFEKTSISTAQDIVIYQCKAGQLYDLEFARDKLPLCPECEQVVEPPFKRKKMVEDAVNSIVNPKGTFYRDWPKEEQLELAVLAGTNEFQVSCKVCSPHI